MNTNERIAEDAMLGELNECLGDAWADFRDALEVLGIVTATVDQDDPEFIKIPRLAWAKFGESCLRNAAKLEAQVTAIGVRYNAEELVAEGMVEGMRRQGR